VALRHLALLLLLLGWVQDSSRAHWACGWFRLFLYARHTLCYFHNHVLMCCCFVQLSDVRI